MNHKGNRRKHGTILKPCAGGVLGVIREHPTDLSTLNVMFLFYKSCCMLNEKPKDFVHFSQQYIY